jgi:DNA-binding transcriptional LysR family regulator
MKTHDGIELEMDVTNKSKVLEALELNEVDFALVSILPEHLKIEQIDLMPNRLFLVGNKEYNFKKSVSPEQIFKQLPLIFREKGSGTRQAMERFINQNAIIVPKKMELTSNEAVKQAILAGLGCSVMPIIGIRKEIVSNELQIIPTKGLPIETTWRLIWLKGKNHSPVAAAFLDYLAKEKEQIIQEKFE